MLDIGTTDFYIKAPFMSRGGFELYSVNLFDEWEKQVGDTLSLSDYSLQLIVEEGSVKGRTKIAATVAAIYFGIGSYGSFMSGLNIISSQIRATGLFVGNHAATPFGSEASAPVIRNRAGAISHLHRLFVKVNHRELTPEQAMCEAE